MRRIQLGLAFAVILLVPWGVAHAAGYGSAVSVQCVHSNLLCTNGIDNSTPAQSAGTVISAAGYYTSGDGGGGNFMNLGQCDNSGPYTGTWTAGSTNVAVNTVAGLAVGSLVQNASFPTGSQILAISSVTTAITVSVAPASGGSGTLTFAVNGGTLVQDQSLNCVQRTDYRGDPHEWGAYGNGNTDDTTALQNWLGGPAPWRASIPATYITNQALNCWPNMNLQAAANNSREQNANLAPLVTIAAGTNFPPGSSSAPNAVLTAQILCRISGLSINALVNTMSCLGNNNCYVDAVNVVDNGVVIDGHSVLEQGYYNLYCNNGTAAGMQLKDSQFTLSFNDNIHMGLCANVRIIGDVVSQAGTAAGAVRDKDATGIYYSGDEMTIANGMVEQSQGAGIWLDTANHISVSAMSINSNGLGATTDHPGIEVDSSNNVSICANHFIGNDAVGGTAQIRFGYHSGSSKPISQAVTLCGNNYDTKDGLPQYVYDASSSAQATGMSGIYETAQAQTTAVFSSGALTYLLPYLQYSPGFMNNYLTGLILSNDSTHADRVNFGAGQAADSTNAAIMTLPAAGSAAACFVGFNQPDGLNGLDTGMAASNTTYFYYLVAQPGGASPSCIASLSATGPTLPTGYTLYRMVGALFTKSSNTNVIPFTQNDDRFILATSGAASATVSNTTNTTVNVNSVPSLISVDAFGRCVAGSAIMLASANTTAQAPTANFTTKPGYMVNSSTPNTSFPYELYTTGSGTSMPPVGTIKAQAVTNNTSLQCYNDGWIWRRGR